MMPRRWPGLAPVLTLALLTLPLAAGIVGTLAPAFGYHPAIGAVGFSLDPWRSLLAWPGLGDAMRLSLVTGLASTAIALAVTVSIVGCLEGTRLFRVLVRLLSPLLSVPHAAAALGLAFLIAPSGWIARLLSPWLTGWERPPDLLIVNDPLGLALIAGLVVKEVPFLLLMTLAALAQADAARTRVAAEVLGYRRAAAWLLTVLPRVYPQIRLPVYAVLAFSLSVVDVAAILGPTRPPPLAVQVLDWMNDPDIALRLQASAGAVLQLLLVLFSLGLWRGGEIACGRLVRILAARGQRMPGLDRPARFFAVLGGVAVSGAVIVGLAGLAVWSFAGLWQFPDAVPRDLTTATWQRAGTMLGETTSTTFLIAACATAIALLCVLGCLETEYRRGLTVRPNGAMVLLYLPLIVPQIAFLPGIQVLVLVAGGTAGFWTVVAGHVVFVLPYVFLALADPWRSWDGNQATVAATLGAGAWRIFWSVRIPMLIRPILAAAGVGFAVSIGQYLPTILLGAGRVDTLTTEAVALASGGNRRVIGVHALLQAALPAIAFALALAVPAVLHRNRKALGAAA